MNDKKMVLTLFKDTNEKILEAKNPIMKEKL